MLRNLRRSIVLGTLVLWAVAMLAVPLSFADTEEDCGPYTGVECEDVVVAPPVDEVDDGVDDVDDGVEEDVVEDDVVEEDVVEEDVVEEDVEVRGEVRTAPEADETEDAISVEPVSTTDEPSVLAVTGVDSWVLALVGVLLLGAGIVFVRTRRQDSSTAG